MRNMIYGYMLEFEEILAFLEILQAEIHELRSSEILWLIGERDGRKSN